MSRLLLLQTLIFICISFAAAFPAFAAHASTSSSSPSLSSSASVDVSKRTQPIANVDGLVSVPDDTHPFIAPGPTDQRGPCPGLNTLANHGYIPRSGIVNTQDIITGTAQGFNMGTDTSTFLMIVAMLEAGDLTTGLLSIGGPDSRTSLATGLLSGELGTAGGLDYHAGMEGDASATRHDQYFGDDHSMQPNLYQQMKTFADNYGGLYTMDALKDHAEARYQNSIATNPVFNFLPPAAPHGLVAKAIPALLFTNGTYGAGGVANEASISAFFGAQLQADGSYTSVPERFPDNWYRRGTPLTLAESLAVLADFIATRNFAFGTNTGTPNSFAPMDMSGLTNVNDLACVLRDTVEAAVPSILAKVVGEVESTVTNLLGQLDGLFDSFGCPASSDASSST